MTSESLENVPKKLDKNIVPYHRYDFWDTATWGHRCLLGHCSTLFRQRVNPSTLFRHLPSLMRHPRNLPASIHPLIRATIHLFLLIEHDDATMCLPPTIQTAVQDHVCHSLWSAKNNDQFLPLTPTAELQRNSVNSDNTQQTRTTF